MSEGLRVGGEGGSERRMKEVRKKKEGRSEGRK